MKTAHYAIGIIIVLLGTTGRTEAYYEPTNERELEVWANEYISCGASAHDYYYRFDYITSASLYIRGRKADGEYAELVLYDQSPENGAAVFVTWSDVRQLSPIITPTYARCDVFSEGFSWGGGGGSRFWEAANKLGVKADWYTSWELLPIFHASVKVAGRSGDDDTNCYAENPGCGVVSLYQSGAYDKPVMIAYGFDQDGEHRPPIGAGAGGTRALMQRKLKSALKGLYSQGVDVWLFTPNRTTNDLHEQSAELAQALDHAAGFGGGDRNVSLIGVSAGGVVARMTTARWDSDDSDWKTVLGLTHPVSPVSFLGMYDSPNQGANVNRDLRSKLIEFGLAQDKGLFTCAAFQLLRESTYKRGDAGYPYDDATSEYARQFFQVGGGITVAYHDATWSPLNPTSGLNILTCEGGPAVDTMGPDQNGYPRTEANGGPHVVALTNGQIGQVNTCYKDSRDWNDMGRDLCVSAARHDRRPEDPYLWVNVHVNLWQDEEITARFTPWDLVPGSRSDFHLAEIAQQLGGVLSGEGWGPFVIQSIEAAQYGSPTFIPITSALDDRDCDHFYTYSVPPSCNVTVPHSRIDDVVDEMTFQGSHANQYPQAQQLLGAAAQLSASP